jgi:very-short-patch-repair endonuclease
MGEDLIGLVRQKIEYLRPKLLDLSRRNPLIATKLSPRSNSHIRVVDELPDVLFFKLNNGQEMQIIPLPPIEEDPRDERSDSFRDALANARLTDEQYLNEMEGVDRDAEDYLDRTRKIERALRDRLRDALGLPPRANRSDLNLAQHAKNNGILPSYELPQPNGRGEQRYTDDNIQTLLLPNDLERKLNAIVSKCRTWMQETGMNVMQMAYGFLEWSDGVQPETSFAPLILCQAKVDRPRTQEGTKFMISGTGDEPEVNAVLGEKLRIDFGIELPAFDGASVEKYMSEVGRLAPKNISWRVRRQVAIGLFPSARMAMYKDLDTRQQSFPQSDIVQALLAGSGATSSSPFADEYEVDLPEIEGKVPCVVMEVDSSQFSTLVDVAEGKNVAVEGPPGTGKSQTIVNAIASALADGKKVLFVAEKLAALNVVKSRLEAVDLGEFLLPLQAERSTREQVVSSIRDRLEMRDRRPARDYDEKLQRFRKVRDQLAQYIALMTTPFADSGMTVHEVIGKSIATNGRIEGLSAETLVRCMIPRSLKTRSGLSVLRQAGEQIEKAHADAANAKPHWKFAKLTHPSRFTVEEACAIAKRAAQQCRELANERRLMSAVGIESDAALEDLRKGLICVEEAYRCLETLAAPLLAQILAAENASAYLERFIARCENVQSSAAELSKAFRANLDRRTASIVRVAATTSNDLKLATVNVERLETIRKERVSSLHISQAVARAIAPLVAIRPESRTWYLRDIAKARAFLKAAGREALMCRNSKAQANVDLLQKLCEQAISLLNDRNALAERISFAADVTDSHLLECVSALRAAGPLSFLSSRYRSAKRLFRSMSKAPKYVWRDAIAALDALIAFRTQEGEFLAQATNSFVFGRFFRGLATDFQSFRRLAFYYQEIDKSFSGIKYEELRNFLREADVNELYLVPPLQQTELTIDYDGLMTRIADTELEIQQLEEGKRCCTPCVGLFVDSNISPKTLLNIVTQLDAFLVERDALDADMTAHALLGDRFAGWQTATERLRLIAAWALRAKLFPKLFGTLASAADLDEAKRRVEAVLSAEHRFGLTMNELSGSAKVDVAHFQSKEGLDDVAFELELASEDADGLFAHGNLRTALTEVEAHGILPLIQERMRGPDGLFGLGDQAEALAVRQMAKALFAESPALSKYRGSRLNELRAELAALDKEIIQLSRQQLRAKVKASAKPPPGIGLGKKSTWTEMALIENEISKKQRFIPVRDLTHRAGKALLEIKPCWMMSPLAVAQYVRKGSVQFDLCIIDEASQMPPESAIGALLRSNQAMVVGDTNQLPPSNFFKTVIDDEDASEDEAVLNESILELANATFRPPRRLRWHYRSRHSALIKFSNRLVYDDNLIVFPSATESLSRMGVEYHHVNGRYKAGTNPIEAQALIDAAVEFMRRDPDRSLGIVTLNQKQRDLILEEFEFAIAKHRHIQKYIDEWKERKDGLEEFFIKNLENVQGDERDVIFIGTVYGAEDPGARVMQRFGPINGLAGKRRLNVLFTRAKEKIVTFSSMTAADIIAEEYSNPGVHMLKRWLEYSASGVLDAGEQTVREPDSDFEAFVADQIRAMGCTPIPQVGVAGYFIDIGVRHPDWPYGFVLGVECDGATYHSAKSARDRDRLRQEVLESLGWKLHRIWSTDWFNNPRKEAELLRTVIASRLAELKGRIAEFSQAGQMTSAPIPKVHTQTPLSTTDLFHDEPKPPQRVPEKVNTESGVAVGDTVRVRYLTDDKKTVQMTISRTQSNPSNGVIYYQTPIARALLGAEEGEEVEVLVGSYIRPAVVESISKSVPL